jgi:cyclopropane fatty-acyl-phospholipid synthase-like methyltransferase
MINRDFVLTKIRIALQYFSMTPNILFMRLRNFFFEKLVLGRQLSEFWSVFGGHIYFQGLASAVQFNLFSILNDHPGLDIKQICTRLGIQEQPARILMLNLTAARLLKKKGTRYYNKKAASLFLVKGKPYDMSNIILWQHFINYRAMFYFYESIKQSTNVGLQVFPGEEKTLYERLHRQPELHKIFQDAMQEISAQANSELVTNIDLRSCKVLVDVGGGNGSNLIRLVTKHPGLKGILFDFAPACKIAEENFKKNNISQDIKAYPGNCFSDKFPAGIDAILFCHFFTIWSPEENQILIKKSFDSLPENGKLFIFNMVQLDSEDGPMTAAIGSPYFLTLATGKGMLYTAKEYKLWMLEAGFKKVDIVRLPRDHVLITAEK